MLEFIHLSGAEAGKDEDTRRKVRSQAMRDFRKRQREEKESGSRKRPSRPSSVQGTTLEWHPPQRSVSATSSTRPRSNASARPPVAVATASPEPRSMDPEPSHLPLHAPNPVRPPFGQRAISHPITKWTPYLTPSPQPVAIPTFDFTNLYLNDASLQPGQQHWMPSQMGDPLQYSAPMTNQAFSFCDNCALATVYPGLCDLCAKSLLSGVPLGENWSWNDTQSLDHGTGGPRMEWMC